MKALFIFALISAKFSDTGISNGTYHWLRLNQRGRENTACLKPEELEALAQKESMMKGTIEIEEDKLISQRSFNDCSITETIRLIHLDNGISTLKIEDVAPSKCTSIESLRRINIERPYDDENLVFTSPFKMVEIKKVGDFIEFRRSSANCFYAR